MLLYNGHEVESEYPLLPELSSLWQFRTATSDRYYQKEVHPRRWRDPKFPYGDSNTAVILLDSYCRTQLNIFSRLLIYIIDSGFEVSCILIFTVQFDT